MTTTDTTIRSAEGSDFSDYQPVQTVSEIRAKDFTFAKATEGTNWTGRTFASNWANQKAAGKPRGAYHFLHPGEDPVLQARHFIAVISAAGGLEPGDMLAVDSEIMLGVEPTGRAHLALSEASLTATAALVDTATKAFLDEVCRLVDRSQHPILVYTMHAVGQYLHETAAAYPEPWFAWPSATAPDAALIAPFRHWRFWQWGADANGDKNAYDGTVSQLEAWLVAFRSPAIQLTPGHVAYRAYGRATGWKNFQGQQMPHWAALPATIQAAWEVAAKAVQAMP